MRDLLNRVFSIRSGSPRRLFAAATLYAMMVPGGTIAFFGMMMIPSRT